MDDPRGSPTGATEGAHDQMDAPSGSPTGAAAGVPAQSAEQLRRALARAASDAFESLRRAQEAIERDLNSALESALRAHSAPQQSASLPAADSAPSVAAHPGPNQQQPAAPQQAPGVVPECHDIPGMIAEVAEVSPGEVTGIGSQWVVDGGPLKIGATETASEEPQYPQPACRGNKHPGNGHLGCSSPKSVDLMGSSQNEMPRRASVGAPPHSSRSNASSSMFIPSGRPSVKYAVEVAERWERVIHSLLQVADSEQSQIHSSWTGAQTMSTVLFAPRSEKSAADLFRTSTGHLDGDMPSPVARGAARFQKAMRGVFVIVLNPVGKNRLAWDFAGLMLCLHDTAMLPAEVFVLPKGYIDFHFYFEIFSNIFWTIDMAVNFSTGYISDEGLLEMRKAHVVQRYLRTWAIPDFVVTFFGWVSMLANLNNSHVLRLGKVVARGLRALRLTRLPRKVSSIREIFHGISSEYLNTLAIILKLLFSLILITHYVACMWHWLAENAGDSMTWKDMYLDSDGSQAYEYLTSMHWAITQFTPASMEVFPVNVPERLFACIIIVMAMVVFSSFVTGINQAMSHLRHIHSRRLEQARLTTKYFSEFGISRELASRCKHFMAQHERMGHRRIKGTDVPCGAVLPKSIVEDLRYEALAPWLKAHPLFDFYSVLCPIGMRQVCCAATEEISLLPQEEIYWHGRVVNRMLFVRVGSMFYSVAGSDIPSLEVKVGEWACEETLWSKVSSLSAPLIASTFGCELIVVVPAEFQKIAAVNVQALSICVNYADLFINAFNRASSNAGYQNLLFNDRKELLDLVHRACVGMDQQRQLKKRFGNIKSEERRSSRSSIGSENLRASANGKEDTSPGCNNSLKGQ